MLVTLCSSAAGEVQSRRERRGHVEVQFDGFDVSCTHVRVRILLQDVVLIPWQLPVRALGMKCKIHIVICRLDQLPWSPLRVLDRFADSQTLLSGRSGSSLSWICCPQRAGRAKVAERVVGEMIAGAAGGEGSGFVSWRGSDWGGSSPRLVVKNNLLSCRGGSLQSDEVCFVCTEGRLKLLLTGGANNRDR